MPKILFIASHRPGRAPCQRFRFEQYMKHLEQAGFSCELSYLVDEKDDKTLYRKGHYFHKARFILKSHLRRKKDVARMNDVDIVLIQREALMTGSTKYERLFRKADKKMVFDFDDSIWLQNVSDANKRWKWLKDPSKTSKLIELSDGVFAGNQYLAEYASKFNDNVTVVPTTIDTDQYTPRIDRKPGPVKIGWSGSITTIQHFRFAIPFLHRIKEKFAEKVEFLVIGDGNFKLPELGIAGIPWKAAKELDDLRAMDIGIMPLPDDEWARGKCGLKGLQYMALGIPTIMSPVGVNCEIIADGENGYLAANEDEWVEKLSRLVEDAELRQRMGIAARRTVEERYSTNAWKDRYSQLFKQLLEERKFAT